MKKTIKTTLITLIVIGGIIALGFLIDSRPYLPPTTIEGHVELSPDSHVIAKPMPENIQKHMLEHADGKGEAGVIVQYNCDKFECESDLIEKLTALVEQYPNNVYLAPNNYDGKIILTKRGKIEILDTFDENAIRDFIE